MLKGADAEEIADHLGVFDFSPEVVELLAKALAYFLGGEGAMLKGTGQLADLWAKRSGSPGATGKVILVLFTWHGVPYGLVPVPAIVAGGTPHPENGKAWVNAYQALGCSNE
jgi:hypothetical protein